MMHGSQTTPLRTMAVMTELERARTLITGVAIVCFLVSTALAILADSPWQTTRTVWTVFVVIALVCSQSAMSRIERVVNPRR